MHRVCEEGVRAAFGKRLRTGEVEDEGVVEEREGGAMEGAGQQETRRDAVIPLHDVIL
jgi:hypothetical protein